VIAIRLDRKRCVEKVNPTKPKNPPAEVLKSYVEYRPEGWGGCDVIRKGVMDNTWQRDQQLQCPGIIRKCQL